MPAKNDTAVVRNIRGLEELVRRWSKARVDLRIGAGEGWLDWLIIPALNQFEKHCDNVIPVLYNLRNEEIDQWLLDGRLGPLLA
jgi:hypothetical protein